MKHSAEVRAVGRAGGVIVPRHRAEDLDLDPYDFRVAVWLSTHTAEYGEKISQRGVCRRLGMSQERVQKSLRRLEALGLVALEGEGFRGALKITLRVEAWESNPQQPLATREVTARHTSSDCSPGETQENTGRNTSSSSSTSSPPGKPRERDEVWDALTEVCGEVSTRSEISRRAGMVKQLKEIGATPKQVRERAAEMRRRWPRVTVTDSGLVGRWTTVAPRAARHRTVEEVTAEQIAEYNSMTYT